MDFVLEKTKWININQKGKWNSDALGLFAEKHTSQNLGYYYVITEIGKPVISRCNRDFSILQI